MASGIADYITAAGALLGGVGALVAGIAAWRALNTWRDQLNGQARFDTAKRLLTAAHDFAEKFHGARARILIEPQHNAVLSNPKATALQRADECERMLTARWAPVHASGANMLGILPEARALLPAGTAEAAEGLFDSANTLRTGMGLYVSMVADYRMGCSDADTDVKVQAEWRRVRKQVYSSDPRRSSEPESDNPLTREFVERHEVLVKLLEPHIQRPGRRLRTPEERQ